jgi:hypothetical protein
MEDAYAQAWNEEDGSIESQMEPSLRNTNVTVFAQRIFWLLCATFYAWLGCESLQAPICTMSILHGTMVHNNLNILFFYKHICIMSWYTIQVE